MKNLKTKLETIVSFAKKEKITFLLALILIFIVFSYVFVVISYEPVEKETKVDRDIFYDFFGKDIKISESLSVCAGFINVTKKGSSLEKEKEFVKNSTRRRKEDEIKARELMLRYREGKRIGKLLSTYHDFSTIEAIKGKCKEKLEKLKLENKSSDI